MTLAERRDFPLHHQLTTVEEQSFLELWELQNKKVGRIFQEVWFQWGKKC